MYIDKIKMIIIMVIVSMKIRFSFYTYEYIVNSCHNIPVINLAITNVSQIGIDLHEVFDKGASVHMVL